MPWRRPTGSGREILYGKKYFGITRSSFLIDEKGRIVEAWYKVSPEDTVPKALAALGAAKSKTPFRYHGLSMIVMLTVTFSSGAVTEPFSHCS